MNFYFGYSFNIELYHVTNYVGYFVLGYYLAHFKFKKIWENIAITLGVVGFILTFFLTYYSTTQAKGALEEFWYEYHSPNVMLSAVGVFLTFKLLFSEKEIPYLLNGISRFSFGIYLVHLLVMKIFSNKIIGIVNSSFPSAISIPLNVLFIVTISAIITFILSKIPCLRKLVP
jgi:surface polysaccharide O-acyltransferase-like enzyme